MIAQYCAAGSALRDTLPTVFAAMRAGAYFGLWRTLDSLLMGFWLLGIGRCVQVERRALGVVTQLAGLRLLIVGIGRLAPADVLVGSIGVPALALLLPVWIVWMGIVVLRLAPPRQKRDAAGSAAGIGEVQPPG